MSRALRERLEAAQAHHRDELAAPAPEPADDARLRSLQEEVARFERTASALRRRLDAHRERQRRLDELRSGTPLHPAAWFAVPVVVWGLALGGWLPPVSWLDDFLVGLASVEAWCWVKQAQRSARLRNDYGSLGSAEDIGAQLECTPMAVRVDPPASNSGEDDGGDERCASG